MATTIITKHGSGAPAAGDLVQGELAVDLANKTLYSKDSSGTVIKVGDTGGGSSGTFTDLTATVSLTANGILYPTTDGTDGQAILTDGNGTLAFGDVVGGIDYTTETSNYTLEANQGVIADTTGGTFVVTLPLTPAEGDQVVVADGGDWSTINLTVGRNGQTIEGVASDLTMDVGGISVTMVFDGTTWQLYPATGTSAGTTYTLDQTTTAGNVTTNDITVGNLTSTGIDDNATSTAITIDASQNVGIGRQNPSAPLDVAMVSGDYTKRIQTTYPNGSSGQPSFGWKFLWGGNAISPEIGLLHGGSYTDAGLYFDTVNAGAKVSAMRIDADGRLLVGTALDPDSGGAGVKLENSSSSRVGRITMGSLSTGSSTAISFRNSSSTSGAIVGSIVSSPTVTAYNTSSDVRLKKNVVDAPAGNIDDIKIRSFAWKVDGSQQKYGVVAQELFKVAPEAVFKGETEDDTWGVDYSKLVPMMIKEIQDLKAEVAALKGVN